MPSKFTPEADSLILSMRASGATFIHIAAALAPIGIVTSRPKASERHRWLTMSPDLREQRRMRINANRRARAISKASLDTDAVINPRPTADVLAERDRRSALRWALPACQALMGDPLPGYSALDRRVST